MKIFITIFAFLATACSITKNNLNRKIAAAEPPEGVVAMVAADPSTENAKMKSGYLIVFLENCKIEVAPETNNFTCSYKFSSKQNFYHLGTKDIILKNKETGSCHLNISFDNFSITYKNEKVDSLKQPEQLNVLGDFLSDSNLFNAIDSTNRRFQSNQKSKFLTW